MGRWYYGADWHLLYLMALNLAFFSTLYLLARHFIRAARNGDSVAAGALVVLALLAILTSLGMPSLSYLFAWTALAGCSY